jgi:hypothetical protein
VSQRIYSRFEYPIDNTVNLNSLCWLYEGFELKYDIEGRQINGFSSAIRLNGPRAAIILTYDEDSHLVMRLKLAGIRDLDIKVFHEENNG